MPAASRVGDETLCLIEYPDKVFVWEAREVATGQPNVKAEGAAAATTQDITTHPCSIIEGSSRVFVNGSPWSFAGAGLSCTGHIVEGSSRVTISS